MRTLLYRKNISSRTNGQVAARRVTGLIIKRLWYCYEGNKLKVILIYNGPRNVYQCELIYHPVCGMSYGFFEHNVLRNSMPIAAATNKHGCRKATIFYNWLLALQGDDGQLGMHFLFTVTMQTRNIALILA